MIREHESLTLIGALRSRFLLTTLVGTLAVGAQAPHKA